MIDFPMNVTDCYKCGYFRKGGHFTCQKFPHPHYVEQPTDDPNARYLVPAPVTWRNPDGKDIHCNSFVEYVKETLLLDVDGVKTSIITKNIQRIKFNF